MAGFNRWKSLGRTVRKGEKGIQIFAPCKYRTKIEDSNGDEQTLQQLRGFRVVHVFDIAQTDGDPIEGLDGVRPVLLDNEAPKGLWDSLVSEASDAGFDVTRTQRASENGFCDFTSKTIAVSPDIGGLQATKTLIHELAHALLYSTELSTSREVAEVEVESAAYVVLDTLGLSSAGYSFPYIARWASGDLELVRSTAERAITCAKSILDGLGLAVEVAAPSAASA